MVLPSGETRVSSVPKANPLSPSPLRNASDTDQLNSVETTTLDHAGVTDNTSTLKQTDVGSTDPRLVRNVASSRNEENEFCFNETINNFTTGTAGGFVDVEVAYDDVCLSDRALAYRSGSLSGRFARACLLHDVMSPPGLALRNAEMPTKTSQQNLRCSSVMSDCTESGTSVQSGTGTPNDESQLSADNADPFPEISSDLSMSADEQMNASLSETGTHTSSSVAKVVRAFVVEESACGSGTSVDTTVKEGLSVRKTPEDGGGDFDVYNIEMTLPYMNWDYLEEQLQRAIEKEQLSQTQRNDREKIRQKLAMGVDEDHFGATGAGASDRLFKKPSLQMRLHSAMNLQMCFVNEASAEAECAAKTGSMVETTSSSSSSSRDDCRSKKSYSQVLHSLSSSTSLTSSKSSLQSGMMAHQAPTPLGTTDMPKEEFDFFTRQARLQAEARLALAQVSIGR